MQNEIRFQRLGGSCQLLLEDTSDLRHVTELNDAHWIMTSVRTDSILCDKDFLHFLDSDGNGRIRVDEVKEAIRWMLRLFITPEHIMDGSDELALSSISEQNPEGRDICRTVRIALANLGQPESSVITLSQICDQKKIISDALQNGDGIIPPEQVRNEAAADCIRLIMRTVGKQADLCGMEGVSDEQVNVFEKKLADRLSWLEDEAKQKEALYVFGEKTAAIYDKLTAVREKLDEFFRSCEALKLSGMIGDTRVAVRNTLDPMDAKSVEEFLEKSPVAPVNPEGRLALEQIHHPLWREKVHGFLALLPEVPTDGITAGFYAEIKQRLAAYGNWISRKPETGLEGTDPAQLRMIQDDGILTYIRDLIVRDKSVKTNLDQCDSVRKLILFQKYMLEFLNNFVTLDRIFDHTTPSMIQAGHLVMDGRIFTLCTTVHNVAEHKKIATNSNICVMYLDAVTGQGAKEKKMKIAVAVTSGHIRHLFVGKSGIFYTVDGELWDAKVCDFIQQPVSIPEAIKMPFYKFADFIQKQADKFFSARSKQYEDTIAKDIQANAKLPTTPPAPAAAPAPAQQTPAVSGSMVLMGGGVGIAAIGSAFAFMAKSIQGVSVGAILAVFFGILLIFGGPIITLSLMKLFRRNLAIFLEANGNALNGQMRLSLRMGRFFTFKPSLPKHALIFARYLMFTRESVSADVSLKRRKIVLYVLLIIMLLECLALLWLYRASLLEYWQKMF